ncbi:MAG: putative manganese-dependent inorganic diphosphatase [Verrucomicrobia bacterium]|nr:putative manganese-dependent inorganic diphosphatase [Verrucomicrobiota bacterium]
MKEILVIGHRNPDTDSICSAIGYAEFKRRTGMPHAIAARCGDTNERIDFVLQTFGVPPPKFVPDVSPKIRDVMETNVLSVPPNSTVAEALAMMDEKNIRVLPVLDEHRKCRGLVSVFKMGKFFFPTPNRIFDSRKVVASINNLARTLSAEVLCSINPDQEDDFVMMIGAMNLDSFTERLHKYPPEKLMLVVGDRREIQELAIDEKVRVIIVTGGLPVQPRVVDGAKRNGVSLLVSPHDSATTAILCRAAITVDHMLHKKFLVFSEDESLAAVKSKVVESPFQAFPIVNDRKQTVGILSKTDLLKKIDRKLILVDHNELSQAVRGADKVEILEIIDHHRIGSLTTNQPILFRNEPVGSTSTIVAESFFREEVEMPKQIAGLLLAGLVSDTLNLTSPTATGRDGIVLKRLEKIAGVNAAEFTEKLFASGSVLISKPAEQAIATDCKEYVEKEYKFSVAQIEELGFDQFWKRKEEVLAALRDWRKEKNYYFACLLVTDVVHQASVLVVTGDKKFLEQINYPEIEPGFYELAGIVSRKKQLLPYLSHCLDQLG